MMAEAPGRARSILIEPKGNTAPAQPGRKTGAGRSRGGMFGVPDYPVRHLGNQVGT